MRVVRSVATLIATLCLTSAIDVQIPDGLYDGEILPNGAYIWASVASPSDPPYYTTPSIKSQHVSALSAKFSKRRTDCWGTSLSHSGVNIAMNGLCNWADKDTEFSSGSGGTNFKAARSQGVTMYYCINARNARGNLNREDFNFTARQMDAKCRPYEASWYGWDGSVEIVGKARD